MTGRLGHRSLPPGSLPGAVRLFSSLFVCRLRVLVFFSHPPPLSRLFSFSQPRGAAKPFPPSSLPGHVTSERSWLVSWSARTKTEGKTSNVTLRPGPTKTGGNKERKSKEGRQRGNARTPVRPLFWRATTKPCTPKLLSSYGFLLLQILTVSSRCNKPYCNLLTQTQKPNLHVSKHITLM